MIYTFTIDNEDSHLFSSVDKALDYLQKIIRADIGQYGKTDFYFSLEETPIDPDY